VSFLLVCEIADHPVNHVAEFLPRNRSERAGTHPGIPGKICFQ
jgi:hypothetical protein